MRTFILFLLLTLSLTRAFGQICCLPEDEDCGPFHECDLLFPDCFIESFDCTTIDLDWVSNEDVTMELQCAINLTPVGMDLTLPSGSYKISQPISICKEIRLIGAGNKPNESESTTLIFSPQSGDEFTTADDYYEIFDTRVGMLNIIANNVEISNIALDQNFRASGREAKANPDALIGGIMIGGRYLNTSGSISGANINNVSVIDYYGDAIGGFGKLVRNSSITHNFLESTYITDPSIERWPEGVPAVGEQGIGLAQAKNVTIANNIILGALDDAIATHGRSNDVHIFKNYITTTGGRILLNGITNGMCYENTLIYIEKGSAGIQIGHEGGTCDTSYTNNMYVVNNRILIQENAEVSHALNVWGGGDNINILNNCILSLSDNASNGISVRPRTFESRSNCNEPGPDGLVSCGGRINIYDNEVKGFDRSYYLSSTCCTCCNDPSNDNILLNLCIDEALATGPGTGSCVSGQPCIRPESPEDPIICHKIDSKIQFSQTSIVGGFSLFPNPNNGDFTVESMEGLIKECKIFSSEAMLIHQVSDVFSKSISIQNLELHPGSYFFVLTDDLDNTQYEIFIVH